MTTKMKRKRAEDGSSSPAATPRQRSYGASSISKHTLPIRDSFESTTSARDETDDTIVLAGPRLKATSEVAAKPIETLEEKLPQADGETIVKVSNGTPASAIHLAQKEPDTVPTKTDAPPSPKRRKTGKAPKASDADFVPETPISPSKPKVKPRTKVAKPPPDNPLFWQDSEITGDIITDPDDDGEGLNGVGFELPPHRAYAVKKERRQKIIEWNNLLAKEARQERSKKRRSLFGGDGTEIVGLGEAGDLGDEEAEKHGQKKAVRFDVAMSASRHQAVDTLGAESKVDQPATGLKADGSPEVIVS